MESRKFRIMMIGALPPPSIGPYIAMERLLASRALAGAFSVNFLDISDRRTIQTMGRLDAVNVLLAVKHACQCLFRLLFQNPDVVYLGISQGTWGYFRDLIFILPTLFLQKQLVLHLRGSEFKEFYARMPFWLRWVTRAVLGRTARMIVLGECLRSIFDGLMPAERIVVIPNGIAYQAFADRSRNAGSGSASGKRILYLAHLSSRKGLFVVMRSLPSIFEKHPDARATVAGLWQSADEEAEASELINKGSLKDKIHFAGEVTGDDKIRLFEQHDLFVFAPISPEGLPWVLLEAMSAGLPVVTSNQGAISEVVVHGVTGLIIPPTPQDISRAICWLFENPGQAKTFGETGRRRIITDFSEEIYVKRLVNLFREVTQPVVPNACAKTSCPAA